MLYLLTINFYIVIVLNNKTECIKKRQMNFRARQNALSFLSITNAFQMIYDAISNFICYEGRLTCKNLSL